MPKNRAKKSVKLGMASWYRGDNCHIFPKLGETITPRWLRQNVCRPGSPSKPIISKKHYITAFGSCFAQHIKEALKAGGYKVDPHDALITRFGAGSVNVYTLLQQFRWAYGLQEYDDELWIADDYVVARHGEAARKVAKGVFDKTQILILTLGLSEVWYNKITDGVFWRAIPRHHYDPEKHGFRYLKHVETKACLLDIVQVVRQCIGPLFGGCETHEDLGRQPCRRKTL